VHPHGLLDAEVPDSIEAMAVDRLAALRAVRPRGPYVLGGHCNGALVALEMARRLQAGRGGARRGPVSRLRAGPGDPLLAGLAAGMARLPRLSREGGEVRFRRWRIRADKVLHPLGLLSRAPPPTRRPTCAEWRLLAGVAAHTLTALLRGAGPASAPRAAGRDAASGRDIGAGALHAAYRRV